MRFENYLAQTIIKPRQCVQCKNHVATSKVKFTVRTYSLCIILCENETYLCAAHNFVAGPASGMVRYKVLVFHRFTVPSRRYLTQGTRWGHQCPMDTFFNGLFIYFLKIMRDLDAFK